MRSDEVKDYRLEPDEYEADGMIEAYGGKMVYPEDATSFDGELFASDMDATQYAIERAEYDELVRYAQDNSFDSYVHNFYVCVSKHLRDMRPLLEQFAEEDKYFYQWIEDYRSKSQGAGKGAA